VRDATVATNVDAFVGAPRLKAALLGLLDHAPQLAADPAALDLQVMGELALARAALDRGEHGDAERIVDRLLTILMVVGELDGLARDKLGPRLAALVATREQNLVRERLTRLRVTCAGPCNMFVDGRKMPSELATSFEVPLALGSHDVWVEQDEASLSPRDWGRQLPAMREQVLVTTQGQALELSYPRVEVPPPSLSGTEIDTNDKLTTRASTRRIAPRWVEISTITAGFAAAGVGSALWAINNGCSGSGPRVGVDACPRLYNTQNAGISTLVVGASALITGSIMLAIDEHRRQKRGETP
jgi:hypothetical protein